MVRRLAVVGAAVCALGLGGGCVSTAEREAAVERGAMEASARAYEATYKEAVDRGLAPEVAKSMAEKAAELAYRTSKEAAAKVPSTGGLGQVLSSLLYVLVNVGIPMLGKGGGA